MKVALLQIKIKHEFLSHRVYFASSRVTLQNANTAILIILKDDRNSYSRPGVLFERWNHGHSNRHLCTSVAVAGDQGWQHSFLSTNDRDIH